mgnify:CR=1 FL=1
MVIHFEFENKKKKKFSGGGIFLKPYKERQNGVVGSGIMSIDEERKLLLEALNAPTTNSSGNEPRSLRSGSSAGGSSAERSSAEVSGSGFVAVKL